MTLMVEKYCQGWVHPLANPLPILVSNVWWSIVMGAWNLDDKSLGSDIICNTVNLESPQFFFSQRMTNDVGLTFIVGDTTL